MEETARFYGFEPNRAGFFQCPFHTGDRTASLKIYPGSGGWHCFGCQKGGSVIDFVMELFGLSFRQAVLRIQADFGIGDSGYAPPPPKIKKPPDTEDKENALTLLHRALWTMMRESEPESQRWEFAVKQLPGIEYALDCYAERRWRK